MGLAISNQYEEGTDGPDEAGLEGAPEEEAQQEEAEGTETYSGVPVRFRKDYESVTEYVRLTELAATGDPRVRVSYHRRRRCWCCGPKPDTW